MASMASSILFSSNPKAVALFSSKPKPFVLFSSKPKQIAMFSSKPKPKPLALFSSPLFSRPKKASSLFSSEPKASDLLSSPQPGFSFDTFVDALLTKVYMPTHMVKYKHWVNLAAQCLMDLGVSCEADLSEERMENKSCVFSLTNQSAQLYFLEKDLVYMEGQELVEEVAYFHLGEKKDEKNEENKWETLVHHGVILPPLYKKHNVPLLYGGDSVVLSLEQEEVATLYASMLKTHPHMVEKQPFKDNFWRDWGALLEGSVVKDLKLCDFKLITTWIEAEKKKKMGNRGHALKELEDKCSWALVDGVQVRTLNFKIEPPSLFIGRGDQHPKMGSVQRRICPSDITINISKYVPVPHCRTRIPGGTWKKVEHKEKFAWLASWEDPIRPRKLKYTTWEASSNGEN
ncbi:PREDICTED: DNA topoisomerase 1 alpha-like [Camelina sativa]|uniref:DNA topoisomerase 1 alpha-like n=1 Tax=Camelina sativa TaxID=90675 RepID=A0ABM0V3W4_CAMSA|nr:PREDICTED: DNA topoisomerase 1 alpha-like [Camelina sativa]